MWFQSYMIQNVVRRSDRSNCKNSGRFNDGTEQAHKRRQQSKVEIHTRKSRVIRDRCACYDPSYQTRPTWVVRVVLHFVISSHGHPHSGSNSSPSARTCSIDLCSYHRPAQLPNRGPDHVHEIGSLRRRCFVLRLLRATSRPKPIAHVLYS